jgi:flagellar assembly protein FliH
MSEFVPLFAGGGFARDSRFIRAGDATEAPHAPPPQAEAAAAPPEPMALAWAEGHAAGLAEARAEAEALAGEAEAARQAFALSFARLDAELAEALRQKLHATVIALCEESLRPLALDEAALARRVERAVALFARADDERVIRLHPEDLALVAPRLPAEWTFLPDPALERGALRVETQSGGAEDGPEQWRRDIAEALRLC